MKFSRRQFPGVVVILAILAGVMVAGWWLLRPAALPDGVVSANGRSEAVEIDVAAPGDLRVDVLDVLGSDSTLKALG